MKNIRFSIFIAAMILGSFITATGQTADDIVQKHIAAIGGLENWQKLTSIKMMGSINAGGTEIPVTVTSLQGKAQRVEFSLNGMTGYQIVTNTEGWAFNPMAGQQSPQAMTAEDVKQSQSDLDIQGPLIDYKIKGNKVTYLGKDEVEGTDCYKLKVTYPNGKEETMFIDAATYYHIRSVQKIVANGKEEEHTSNYGNYQKLPEGIVWPMSIDDGGGAVAVKTVEVNKPVDESIFKPATDNTGKK
jgi:hypothetical protein